MSGGMIFIGIIVAIVVYGIVLYNNLVGLRNGVKNAFAQIDVQLTRRYDLIPALIESVKGYMKHERETLEAVIKARNVAVSGLQAAAADPGGRFLFVLSRPSAEPSGSSPPMPRRSLNCQVLIKHLVACWGACLHCLSHIRN